MAMKGREKAKLKFKMLQKRFECTLYPPHMYVLLLDENSGILLWALVTSCQSDEVEDCTQFVRRKRVISESHESGDI